MSSVFLQYFRIVKPTYKKIHIVCKTIMNIKPSKTKIMKNYTLMLISTFMAFGISHAQNPEGLIAQPTHVIGKRINANNEVTKTIESDFTYFEDGKPHTFTIPEYELSSSYKFEDEFLIRERTKHDSGQPQLTENIEYTYENGKVKTVGHYWSHAYDYPEYWEYSYGEDGRLARKDYIYGIHEVEDFHQHYLYEYENEGKTKIQHYWTSWVDEGMKLRQTSVYQYDDEYKLITKLVENYDLDGTLTSSTSDNYSYSSSGKIETLITKTLTDGEWVNTSIMHYVYDDADRVVEQQNGSWSAENNDWNINRKVVFEFLEDGATYTVSFYKKNGEQWVWDVFNNQTIFFGSALANQQRTMRFYQKEEYNGLGNINQFEISVVYTEEPIYMSTEENRQAECCVYPNPGSSNLNVQAFRENAVVRFFNLQGQLMIARPFDFSTEINTEGWPVGIYLWEIWNGNQKEATGKWVKE